MKTLMRQTGFSLVELMVALTISLVLLAGVLTIMISSKRTYTLQSELARLQDSARFSIDRLSYTTRLAGFFGCAMRANVDVTTGVDPTVTISGINNQTIRSATPDSSGSYKITAESGTAISKGATPASDVLVATGFFEPIPLQLKDVSGGVPNVDLYKQKEYLPITTNTFLFANVEAPPVVGNFIVISDCGGYSLHKVISVSGHTATFEALTRDVHPPVNIFRYYGPIRYEVRAIDKNDNGTVNDPEDGYALFGTDIEDTQTPKRMNLLVEGVENMQIRFGIDTDDDDVPNRYVPPPATLGGALDAAGGNIVSVRITLLMRTENRRTDLPEDSQKSVVLDTGLTYDLHANTEHERGYRHRVFTMTIQVRN